MEREVTNYLDIEKPELKEDEAMCSSCWKVVKKNERHGWKFYGFKHLANQDICPDCQSQYDGKFGVLQDHGL